MHLLPERVEFELVQLLGEEAPARCLPVDPVDDAFDDPDDVLFRVDRDEVAADPGVAAVVPPDSDPVGQIFTPDDVEGAWHDAEPAFHAPVLVKDDDSVHHFDRLLLAVERARPAACAEAGVPYRFSRPCDPDLVEPLARAPVRAG